MNWQHGRIVADHVSLCMSHCANCYCEIVHSIVTQGCDCIHCDKIDPWVIVPSACGSADEVFRCASDVTAWFNI